MNDTRLEQIRQRLAWDKHPQEISRTDVEYLVERLEAAEVERDRAISNANTKVSDCFEVRTQLEARLAALEGELAQALAVGKAPESWMRLYRRQQDRLDVLEGVLREPTMKMVEAAMRAADEETDIGEVGDSVDWGVALRAAGRAFLEKCEPNWDAVMRQEGPLKPLDPEGRALLDTRKP